MSLFLRSDFFIFLTSPFDKEKRREIKAKEKNNKFKKMAPLALRNLSQVLESYEYNLEVWLSFGTLLGMFREGKIIDYDYDLDFGIYEEFMTEEFINFLIKNGFKLKHSYTIKSNNKKINNFTSEYTFLYKNTVVIDFFVFKRSESRTEAFLFDAEEGLTWAETLDKYDNCVRTVKRSFTNFQLKKIYFYNSIFLIPENTELHLKEIYGDDFMIPKKYNYSNRPLDREILLESSTLGYMTIY